MDWAGFLTTLGQSLSYPAFWVGFGLVVFFALNRFAVSEACSDVVDPPVMARSFTTRFRYYLSATAYIGCYEFFFGLLVGIGSFPFLQGLLKEWIGSLELANGEAVIGTPAWAALVVTSVLPAAPGFRMIDKHVREALHRFASIPLKARALAAEILELVSRTEPKGDNAGGDNAARQQAGQLGWLYHAVEILQDGGENPRNASDYSQFFSRYGGVLQQTRRRKEQLDESLVQSENVVPVIANELNSQVNNAARFLSCALLQIEPSERAVRHTLRETLGLGELPKLEFDFNFKQIIIGLILILLLTFVIGVMTLGMVLPEGTRMSMPMIGFIAGWLPYAALMLVPPFIFAAGVQLHFMDVRQSRSQDAAFEDKLLALIGLFVGSFGIGILPPLAGMAMGAHIESNKWVMQVLPFGLTPACVGITFYLLATRSFLQSKWQAGILDFIVFAVVAGVCTWLSTYVATGFGLDIATAAQAPAFDNAVALRVFPVTAAVLVGVVGALQCSISRRTEVPRNAGG